MRKRGRKNISGRALSPVRKRLSERRAHRDVVTLSDVGAQDAGHHAAEVQQGHAAAPAVVRGSLALHAREAEQPAATWGGRRKGGEASNSCSRWEELHSQVDGSTDSTFTVGNRMMP